MNIVLVCSTAVIIFFNRIHMKINLSDPEFEFYLRYRIPIFLVSNARESRTSKLAKKNRHFVLIFT